ncbi:hypothetical protein [Actinomadura luzonensis]|uniref:hypothetical protein n=1 Tax=Actinomadura luzonensis TaxID=2805427 RepID=UPI001FFF52C3|nr:hypothetical protein [Actinomadura luzonensis]
MGLVEAAAWGLAGGLAAGLISLMAAITAAGFRWPWRDKPEEVWPRIFVLGAGLILGALVAAAAREQMNGAWPAFIMGVGAPSMVRGMLSRVEVAERKSKSSDEDEADNANQSIE